MPISLAAAGRRGPFVPYPPAVATPSAGNTLRLMGFKEGVGVGLGLALSPAFALVAFARQARVFHPSGSCYRGIARSVAEDQTAQRMAKRLEGPALARMSSGTFKGVTNRPDVLGCAVRFGGRAAHGDMSAQAQDILMASFEKLSTIQAGIGKTDVRDYLNNTYWAVAPFRDQDLGDVHLRIRPVPTDAEGKDRAERLDWVVNHGGAILVLEAEPRGGEWLPVVEIKLTEQAQIDQGRLRFSPWNAGCGIEPVGTLNGVRRFAYRASQRARGAG